MVQRGLFFLFMLLQLTACSKGDSNSGTEPTPTPAPPPPPVATVPTMATVKTWLVDKGATDETAALFYNLKKVAKTGWPCLSLII